MSTPQKPLEAGGDKVTAAQRTGAGIVFIVVLAIFGTLWAGAAGLIDMSRWFGICGFKQSFGLPCAGCYMTTSAMSFVQGRVLEAFYLQPAAAVFCCALAATAIFALLIAAFGVDFPFLHQPQTSIMIKYIAVSVIIVIAAGWVVTLARALAENQTT